MKWAGNGGYTIIELMIVLAITGAMIASALALVSGKQATATFNASTRQFQLALTNVATSVSNGYYQLTGNVGCSNGGGRAQVSTATSLGANAPCIFVGDALQYATDGSTYSVVPLMGLRQKNNANVTTYQDSGLTAATAGVATQIAGANIACFLYGSNATAALSMTKPCTTSNGFSTSTTLLFLTTFGGAAAGAASGSGSGQVDLFASSSPRTPIAANDTLVDPTSPQVLAPTPGGVYVCIDGPGSKYALVSFGGTSSNSDADLVVRDGSCK